MEMLSNMEIWVRCTYVQFQNCTSKLNGKKYIHNSYILWCNHMKHGGYVDNTDGH
jgi:hypothetical protein